MATEEGDVLEVSDLPISEVMLESPIAIVLDEYRVRLEWKPCKVVGLAGFEVRYGYMFLGSWTTVVQKDPSKTFIVLSGLDSWSQYVAQVRPMISSAGTRQTLPEASWSPTSHRFTTYYAPQNVPSPPWVAMSWKGTVRLVWSAPTSDTETATEGFDVRIREVNRLTLHENTQASSEGEVVSPVHQESFDCGPVATTIASPPDADGWQIVPVRTGAVVRSRREDDEWEWVEVETRTQNHNEAAAALAPQQRIEGEGHDEEGPCQIDAHCVIDHLREDAEYVAQVRVVSRGDDGREVPGEWGAESLRFRAISDLAGTHSMLEKCLLALIHPAVNGVPNFAESCEQRAQRYLDKHNGDIEAAVSAAIEKAVRPAYKQAAKLQFRVVDVARFSLSLIPGLGLAPRFCFPIWNNLRLLALIARLYGHDVSTERVKCEILLNLMVTTTLDVNNAATKFGFSGVASYVASLMINRAISRGAVNAVVGSVAAMIPLGTAFDSLFDMLWDETHTVGNNGRRFFRESSPIVFPLQP